MQGTFEDYVGSRIELTLKGGEHVLGTIKEAHEEYGIVATAEGDRRISYRNVLSYTLKGVQ